VVRFPAGSRRDDIEALYRARLPHFVRVAAAIVGDRELALDVVQDAFAKCVRARREFRGQAALDTWVWRAVVNTAHSARGRAAPELLEAEAVGRQNGYEPAAPSDLPRLLALLPERQRLAVFLRYYADLEYRAIADVLGIEVGTVSATLNAAHANLRRAIEEVPQ
jgi:RNA polymerase sigma factor (sigma-70 family)